MKYKNDFKVVGYFFAGKEQNKFDRIRYDLLTHINFAFAIPKRDGTLLPLENPEAALRLVKEAHENNCTAGLSVGGWSWQEEMLEQIFVEATDTDAKIDLFVDSVMDMVNEYGFDGVDLDWEYPRAGEPSQERYEKLMLSLSRRSKADGKILTSAVISGVTPGNVPQPEASACTDTVINCVDWLNVMAYDGGDGLAHSSYEFAVNCGTYWRNIRNISPEKIVLGVPFYGRPSWIAYDEILKIDPNAFDTDIIDLNGTKVYYNGVDTIRKKTKWAKENLGGIMFWEVSQDVMEKSKSLQQAIADEASL
jgi:GH18 family chitinase